MHRIVLSKIGALEDLGRGPAHGSAVSSTTDTGIPGPAAITRLPVPNASRTSSAPPVMQSMSTPACVTSSRAVSSVGATTPVIRLSGPPAATTASFISSTVRIDVQLAARVRVERDRVPARQHRDAVVDHERRRRVGRRHRRDHAPRQPVLDRQPVLAGEGARLVEVLGADRALGGEVHLRDLVAHAAEPGLLVRRPRERLGVLVADLADRRDRGLPQRDAALRELPLGDTRSLHRLADRREQAVPAARGQRARARWTAAADGPAGGAAGSLVQLADDAPDDGLELGIRDRHAQTYFDEPPIGRVAPSDSCGFAITCTAATSETRPQRRRRRRWRP